MVKATGGVTVDTTVRGVPIAAGESVYLAYVSGNRDEVLPQLDSIEPEVTATTFAGGPKHLPILYSMR